MQQLSPARHLDLQTDQSASGMGRLRHSSWRYKQANQRAGWGGDVTGPDVWRFHPNKLHCCRKLPMSEHYVIFMLWWRFCGYSDKAIIRNSWQLWTLFYTLLSDAMNTTFASKYMHIYNEHTHCMLMTQKLFGYVELLLIFARCNIKIGPCFYIYVI